MSFPEHHHNQPSWWKHGTVYQIWPMSYKDSNGDGIGDIPGIIGTLDYLKSLGIDVIWLSPMYDSPQKDYGYDISDYQSVYPPFGTTEDLEKLTRECHSRGIKLILDLVINHTSDQHKWFKESKSSRTNEKADWYFWRDPKIIDGKRHPPNNWRAIFGGSAWEYVEERDQYYLHLFVPEQPDLNWENEVTRRAIYKEAIEFWLDRGIDGFRVDTANLYSKPLDANGEVDFSDAPVQFPNDYLQPSEHLVANGPRLHEFLKEQRTDVLSKYGDVLMVGEAAGADYDTMLSYVSAEREELSCIFDFDVVSLGGRHEGSIKKHQNWKYILPDFKDAFRKVQDLIQNSDAWGTVFLENHDQARSISRFVTDEEQYREKAAKLLAVLLSTLTGTLFLYQGQEIGTFNHPKDWTIDYIRDIDSLNAYDEISKLHNGDEMWCKKAMRGIQMVGRDNARLPVQWDDGENGGFTTGKPWIPVHPAYKTLNVASQINDPKSTLSFWKKMLQVRKDHNDVCNFGGFEIHDKNDVDTFTYVKIGKDGREMLIVLNFTAEEQPWDIPPRLKGRELDFVIANTEDGQVGKYLTPYEARVYVTKST